MGCDGGQESLALRGTETSSQKPRGRSLQWAAATSSEYGASGELSAQRAAACERSILGTLLLRPRSFIKERLSHSESPTESTGDFPCRTFSWGGSLTLFRSQATWASSRICGILSTANLFLADNGWAQRHSASQHQWDTPHP